MERRPDMMAWVLTDNGTDVIVGLLGIIGVMGAAWFASDRRTKRVDRKVDVLAASLGPKNGHGTVQDQGARILSEIEELRRTVHSMATTMDSVVDAAGLVRDRLKQHDREHSHHKQRDRELATELDELRRKVS